MTGWMGWMGLSAIIWSLVGVALLVLLVMVIWRLWTGPKGTFQASEPHGDERREELRGQAERKE